MQMHLCADNWLFLPDKEVDFMRMLVVRHSTTIKGAARSKVHSHGQSLHL